jgi:O-Antigen ligase
LSTTAYRVLRSIHRSLDWITEGLLYFAILFGPWAFGTTEPWSIHVMNAAGFALGGLWLVKLCIRLIGYHPLQWPNTERHGAGNREPGSGNGEHGAGSRDRNGGRETFDGQLPAPTVEPRLPAIEQPISNLHAPVLAAQQAVPLLQKPPTEPGPSISLAPRTAANPHRFGSGHSDARKHLRRRERYFTWLLAGITLFLLAYCFVSAWNARAIYHPESWSFEYRKITSWLPHSYDQAASWSAFWKYLGLAGFFWGLRDWLLTLSPGESARFRDGELSRSQLPARLRRLFWLLAINGTVLAVEGLFQRVDGGTKLLWLVTPRFDTTTTSQFGPWAYRANAGQYFNLLWPALLGFWWALVSSGGRRDILSGLHERQASRLLPCIALIAICPLICTSRGTAIVLVMSVILSGGILWMAQWRKPWRRKAPILAVLAGVIVGGALLGWRTLAPRMAMIQEGYDAREGLYITGRYMARDNQEFGAGPGSFATLYQLYRPSEQDEWLAYMHNDYLETFITFGWFGLLPILLLLFLSLSHWFVCPGMPGNKYFVMLLWVALGGCLLHAYFDFPFQIHSVLTLFLVLCAVLSSLSRRAAAS